jgi:alanyl-tRNA synthetase
MWSNAMLTANQIRQQFIDFFVQKHGHTFVPSSSVVPLDDPTLLFTNAGMNQFKDVFLGTGQRAYKRAVDTQKCIRAGGKHNDLDDVGKDTYHHTFFEMLGNWSFGDYFKKEAITWGWDLLTNVWKIDKSRLHVTIFEGTKDVPRDDEAYNIWRDLAGVDPNHIHEGNAKDNFWEMGETGPCGPCTEIHYDRTPNKTGRDLVNKGSPLVVEIWNLVFIQFNRNPDKSLTPLPAKHVDTGMGFERITAVLQGKDSNYDTDIFTPLLDAFGKLTGTKYGGKLDDVKDIGFRVVADHLRMASFAIADGARPGNKKRDAVLRSVIRRAVRFGYQYFEQREPFVYKLLPVLVEQMGGAFPELKTQAKTVETVLRDEEASFFKTIERGIVYFNKAAEEARKHGNRISGDASADLHTTHGFPFDLTKQMAEEQGLSVDEEGHRDAIHVHTTIAQGNRKKMVISAVQGDLPKTDEAPKYAVFKTNAKVLGWVVENTVHKAGKLEQGTDAALLVDRTCFYAEQGGQVGDGGLINTGSGVFEVDDTQKLGDATLHLGRVVDGTISPGQEAVLEVDPARIHTMRNHTATHLMNWALRKVLGDHVEQKGSLVDVEKTRFDFTHPQALTADEIVQVERLVNEKIAADLPVTPITMALADAKKIAGVRAVFGEKYPDPVRVLLIGTDSPTTATTEESVEFCGGTHLNHTGQAGFFKIVSQEPVAKGVRRVTAVTGKEAVAAVQRSFGVLDTLTAKLNCKPEEVPTRIDALQEEVKRLQGLLKKGAASDLTGAADKLFADAVELQGARLIVGEVPAAPIDAMRQQMDRLRQKAKSAVILLGWIDEDKVTLLAAVTEDLVKKGIEAGKLVGEVAKVVGGKGGGRKDMAQAGGPDTAKLADALARGLALARDKLAG